MEGRGSLTWLRKPAVAKTYLSSDISGYVSRSQLVEAIDEAIRSMSEAVVSAQADEVELYVFAIRFLKKLRELLREKEC